MVVATRHDSHEEFAAAALAAGKHVFCEKPLALTFEGLERVTAAWRASAGHLMVGFNRRYAPSVVAARKHMGEAGGRWSSPTASTRDGFQTIIGIRTDAKAAASSVRSATSLIHAGTLSVTWLSSVLCVGSGRGEPLLEQDLIVTLRYSDGSLAAISYSSGGNPSTPKERIEILGRGHSAVVDDFRAQQFSTERAPGLADKGHVAELARVAAGAQQSTWAEDITLSAPESMATTLSAAQSLMTGTAVTPPQVL